MDNETKQQVDCVKESATPDIDNDPACFTFSIRLQRTPILSFKGWQACVANYIFYKFYSSVRSHRTSTSYTLLANTKCLNRVTALDHMMA